MIKAAAVQFNHRPGNKEYNLEQISNYCIRAGKKDVQLISFPEMCITGYWHIRNLEYDQISDLAESIPDGPSVTCLSTLANRHGLIIGAGLIESDENGQLFNSYVVCDVDGRIHRHRKIHCFISEHMISGNSYTVFGSSLGYKIGVLTCYDNNIIENVRMTALMGADILLAPHQTGGVQSRSPHAMGRINPELWHQRKSEPEKIESEFRGPKGREWLMRWLPSRAHDNGLFLLFSNGVGPDDNEVRTGNSMIMDCYGRIIAETWKASDDMVIAGLDMDLQKNCTGRRWLRGRKPDLYKQISTATGIEVDPRKARFSE